MGDHELDWLFDLICSRNCAAADRDFESHLKQTLQVLSGDSDYALPKNDICVAAAIGDVETIRRLLDANHALVNRTGGPWGWSPLLYLCFSRLLREPSNPRHIDQMLESARLLLEAGADANTFFMLGDEKETALYAACGVCNNARLAELLLQHGAEVNDEDATYHVAEFEEHECIRVLFEHGLDADRSATVLLRKLDFDDIDGVKFILDLGCDVNHGGCWKKVPLHQAIMRGRDLRIIELLVERGADVNAKRRDGASSVYLASVQGSHEIVDFLKNSGADATMSIEQSLVAACGMGDHQLVASILKNDPVACSRLSSEQQIEIVRQGIYGNQAGIQLMLKAGWDIAAQDSQGFTALHWAAWHGHLNCVKLLLENDAPVSARNNYGGTVIDSTVWGYANSNGNDNSCREILQMLFEYGADPASVSAYPSGHELSDQVIGELLHRNAI